MDEVFQFDKCLQERLADYLDLFGNKKVRSCAEIKREWSYYLELAIDSGGWQALWKVPRITCEELKIPFPSIILVYVSVVDFSELTAFIKVLAVKEEICIHEEHQVPLIQLWPTKEQDESTVLGIEATANAIDSYRFFYTHVCFPWDAEDDDDNWLEKHLEVRLRLFYDLKNGVIPRYMAEHIRTLLNTARRIQAKCEAIEFDLMQNEVDEENTSDERVQMLMEFNVSMMEIKNEVSLLESPLTRDVILKRKKPKRQEIQMKQFWFVMDEGKLDEYFLFFQEIQKQYPKETFKPADNLQSTLEIMGPEDTVVLWKKNYALLSSSGLECGGTLKGLFKKENTKLIGRNDEIMLDLQGPNVILENLTIDAAISQCGILVRAGKTTLKNCLLVGDTKSTTRQGIIVLKGAEIELLDTEIKGFHISIVGNSGSKITMRNCSVSGSNFGTKIYDQCSFKATDCKFFACKEYAFCVETDAQDANTKNCGDFKLLEVIPDIKCDHIIGENNSKGDVLINPIMKIHGKKDLFKDPTFDPTSEMNRTMTGFGDEQLPSDEEMDMQVNANVTIVENPNMQSDDINITL